MTHAERLRDLAAHETLDAEHVEQEFPDDAALYREQAAACLAGAKALAFVDEIAAEPNEGGVCDYCGRKHWRDGHEPTCRWQQARDLVQPREDVTR